MCVILSIYNHNKDEAYKDTLKKNLFHFQVWNGDGLAHFGHDAKKESEVYFSRTLKLTGDEWVNPALEKEINHFHFRKATHGSISENNIHFWENGDWLFSHNGIVGSFAKEASEKNVADSMLLFAYLMQEKAITANNLHVEKIANIISEMSFWGRLMIINKKTKSVYYFGDYHLYLFGKEMLVVSGTELNLDNGRKFYGMSFDCQTIDVLHKKIDGVFKINPLKRELKEYDVEFGSSFQYGYGYGGWSDLSELSEDDDIPPALRKIKKKGKKKDIDKELERENEMIKDIAMTAKNFYHERVCDIREDYDREGLKQPKLPVFGENNAV